MMSFNNNSQSKIRGEHLGRAAYIYVRQSSHYQVEHNLGSQRRQYDLAELAVELGWPKERVHVIDEDQGKSGAYANARSGFGRLVAAVARGEAGIVMSLEASRLARNSPDWHNLIYMCRFAEALIADEHGVYDPADASDRMVLGIRGHMSEMELETSIHRMIEGRWTKAKRGEFLIVPPAGYDIDDLGNTVISSDEAVRSAIATVFSKFDELGSARLVFLWWRDQGLKFPVRQLDLRTHPIAWKAPEYRQFLSVFHNPIFAGTYAFGRSQTVRELDPESPGQLRIRRRTRAWPVLIRNHHPGYITFEKFQEIQERIRSNKQMKERAHGDEQGPAREGQALLQGMVRCGCCGRAMNVSYGGNRPKPSSRRTMQYRCSSARRLHEAPDCQLVGGKRIDDTVVELFLAVTRGAGEEAGVLAAKRIQQEAEDAERTWRLQIEKAEYEAQRAERQFHAVEPENRLVARSLEARWNACLAEVEEVRVRAAAGVQERRPLTELEAARARRLGSDLESVWAATTTSNRDRKQLLRAAIEEVQLTSEEKCYRVKIVWKGGATTEREVARFRRTDAGKHPFTTPGDTVDMIRKLAVEFDDAQIARILCKQGRRTGEGNVFTAHRVATLRNRNGIPNCPKPFIKDVGEGPFTADEAAGELDVDASTIHRWLRDGILPGRQAAPGAPWRIRLTEELRHRLKAGKAPAGWLGLAEAAQRLGLSKARVAQLVRAGKLKAVRTTVGKRQCWRIDVSSADCGRQRDLLDRMSSAVSKEA